MHVQPWCSLYSISDPLSPGVYAELPMETDSGGKALAWLRQATYHSSSLWDQGKALTAKPHQACPHSSSLILLVSLKRELRRDTMKALGKDGASSPAKRFNLFDIKTPVEKESKEAKIKGSCALDDT